MAAVAACEYRSFQQCIKEKECWNIKARFGYSDEEMLKKHKLACFCGLIAPCCLVLPWEDKRIKPLNVPFTNFAVHFIHLMLLV